MVLGRMEPLGTERVALAQARGRVLAEDVAARVDLPVWDQSAMDGYALRAEDVAGATAATPASLHCVAETPAGSVFGGKVGASQCVRVFTGTPLPAGTDAVVMQEDTRCTESTVLVSEIVRPWENIRLRGEDVRAGETVLSRGTRLSAVTMGLLAAQGVERLEVCQIPSVALIATGNELREAGVALGPGEIHESNRLMLGGMLAADGLRAATQPIVADRLDATCAALEHAATTCEAVITIGGASVGRHDLVRPALEALGGAMHFWKVAIKPGKPFCFGTLSGKPVFGLPGNPVSALVTYLLLVRPALLRLAGASDLALPSHPARLGEALFNHGDRRHFMRVRMDEAGTAWATGLQSSHALRGLAGACGMVDVPPGALLAMGATVTVLRWPC